MNNYDVAVIGGGAAGMACAAELSVNGSLKIVLIEAADRLGKKLAITGNGQGNVSNEDMSPDHYHGGGKALAEKIACADDYGAGTLFNCIFTSDDRGRVYPAGRQASSLVDSLSFTLKERGVEIILSVQVTSVKKGYELKLSDGRILCAEYVVLCTGGVAQPVLKNFSPYALAQNFGHKTTELFPSLVQLKTDTRHIKTLKGIRADCRVTASVDGRDEISARGDVIFTDYGISGNSVFSVSPIFADRLGKVKIEFLPDVSVDRIAEDVSKKSALGYPVSELLSGTLHNQIGRAIIKRVNSSDPLDVAKAVKNFELEVTGTLGFAYAQVTRGGVRVEEVSPDLQSRIADKLYFAGEVLDVDGDCGGYNLNWAFSSGRFVAENILKRI